MVRARRRVFERILPPLLAAAAPAVRAALRRAPANDVAFYAWEHVLRPYLPDPERLRLARTEDGVVLCGTLRDQLFHLVDVFGVYEPRLTQFVRERLRPGDTFVDVGANIGYFTLLGSRLVGPSGTVVSVEPIPTAVAALRRNIAINDATNVRQLALAAHDTEATLSMHYHNEVDVAGASSIWRDGDRRWSVQVPARPLAAALTDAEIARARLIKVDVEGAEAHAVAGLLPALDRMRTDVEFVVELNAGTFAIVRDLFAERGFRASLLHNPWFPASPRLRRGPALEPLAPDAVITDPPEGVSYVAFAR